MLRVLALGLSLAGAQDFGQNHVVKRDFDWKIRSTEHFDIHYYEGSEPLVPFVAEVLERGYADMTKRLDIPTEAPPWAPAVVRKRWKWERRPFFLYASPNDFLQSNVAMPGDGTGGITEPFKNRFMVYHDGSKQWLEEVTLHELAHIFQFHVLITGYWRSGAILKSIVYPLWMMEGMPGWLTYHVESVLEETVIRDAATSGRLISLTRLEHFAHLKPHQVTLGYKQGAAALEFLEEQWGSKKPGQLLKLFESRFETSSVLAELIGLDARAFDRKYREYLEAKYDKERRAEGLKEPTAYGGALTRSTDEIPQFNTSPVFSPDGRTMYFLSTRYGHPPAVMRMDLRTGRQRRLARLRQPRFDNVPLGNFANLTRVLTLSPDGRTLVFMGSRVLRDGLYFYDTRTGALERRELPGFQMATQPSWSPDGRTIAFSGMRQAVSDIYLYDVASGQVTQLTDDAEDDQMPTFTPDGRSVIYSAEVSDPLGVRKLERRLHRVDLATKSVTRLEDLGGEARDPLVSADGKRVLFIREDGRHSELAELDLETGRAARLTRSVGGSFTPSYALGGELAFAALRGGSVHIHKGPRSQFEADPLEPKRDLSDSDKFMLPGMGSVGRSSATVTMTEERPYKFSASTDLFLPAAFYSSVGGFFWTSYWQGSDMLGNHQANAVVSVASGETFDYAARYSYLRWRPQLTVGVQGSGRRNLVESDTNLRVDDSVHAQFAGVTYPFDRFHRAELLLGSINESLDYRAEPRPDQDRRARIASAALVRDTVRGRYLVATAGGRARLFATEAGEVLGGNRRFHTAGLETHKFWHTGGQTALALRLLGVQSLGRDHQNLILGGLGGVRGVGRSTTQDAGTRLGLANLEWRFPVAPDLNYYMWYIFPDFYFKAIFGSIFADAGYAWRTDEQINRSQWRDARKSAGLGLKVYTFILQRFPLVISMDYARRLNDGGGIFYVYLGHLF